MATYYDVLGVSPDAEPEAVRRAYLDLARRLHPDRTSALAPADQASAARRMQQVNDAWRILRDPRDRAEYDRSITGAPRRDAPKPPPRAEPDYDTPIPHTPAEPGDVGVTIARAVPWISVAVILVGIFIFTAFAGGKHDAGSQTLVGHCISLGNGSSVVAVSCGGPNDGRVTVVVNSEVTCPPSTKAHPLDTGHWACVEPEQPRPSDTPVTPVQQ